MAQHHGRAGRPWVRLTKQVKLRALNGEPCWLCGHPIDVTLHHLDPWSFTVDHVVPLSRGGSGNDPANVRPAHRRCNLGRGNREPEQVQTSRRW
jgi:5-methylcytosine-specific restriction endonuclease McrA